MFTGFSREALQFLGDIRENNNKPWFESHKDIYTNKLYHPLLELEKEIFSPFEGVPGMFSKTLRIYRDVFFSDEGSRYRDRLTVVVRRQADWWSKTPTMFFEISAEGAAFGFRILKPEPAVMAAFRGLIDNDPERICGMFETLEREHGMMLGGEEYKRPKPCASDDERIQRFYIKKGIILYNTVSDRRVLFGSKLSEQVTKTLEAVFPLHELFSEIVAEHEAEKALRREQAMEDSMAMPKAPKNEFMW